MPTPIEAVTNPVSARIRETDRIAPPGLLRGQHQKSKQYQQSSLERSHSRSEPALPTQQPGYKQNHCSPWSRRQRQAQLGAIFRPGSRQATIGHHHSPISCASGYASNYSCWDHTYAEGEQGRQLEASIAPLPDRLLPSHGEIAFVGPLPETFTCDLGIRT